MEVRVRVRARFRLRFMFRVTVRVRFGSQEALGTDPTAQHLFPRRAVWSTQGRVPVMISL